VITEDGLSGPDQGPEQDEQGLRVLAVLEAMLFASPEPLSVEEIQAGLPDLSPDQIERGLDGLARALGRPDRGFRLERVAGGFRLVTRPDLAEPLRALFRFRNQRRLTPASLDALAIVAYAQPITAPEIQEIRGTDPAHSLRVLLDRKLLRIVGRKRVVGRPILYGTTREFLIHFGLDTLEDLPPVEGYGTRVVPAQGRLFPVTAFPAEEIDIEPEPGQLPFDAAAGEGGDDAAPADLGDA
jgi:segregation and condensation protein B